MRDLPPAGMTIRPSCGTHSGLRAHANRHEPLCVICQAFVDAEQVEAERRRPTPPAAIPVVETTPAILDDNVVPLRGNDGLRQTLRRIS